MSIQDLGLTDAQYHNLGNLLASVGAGGKILLWAYKFIKKEVSAYKRKQRTKTK